MFVYLIVIECMCNIIYSTELYVCVCSLQTVQAVEGTLKMDRLC